MAGRAVTQTLPNLFDMMEGLLTIKKPSTYKLGLAHSTFLGVVELRLSKEELVKLRMETSFNKFERWLLSPPKKLNDDKIVDKLLSILSAYDQTLLA